MATPRHLQTDPIREAIIDFRVLGAESRSEKDFAAIKSALAQEFPKSDEKRRVEAKIEFRGNKFVADSSDVGFHGLFLKTQDELTIAQFRPDGFTVNRLRPYPGWDTILPLALRLWDEYVTVAKPRAVTRIALRFINALEVPLLEGRDFSVYLAAPPAVPPELPQQLSAFNSRVTIVESNDVRVHVLQSLEEAVVDRMKMLLDIDAFKTGDITPDRDVIKTVLDHLRALKNRVFFSFLTETTVRVYE